MSERDEDQHLAAGAGAPADPEPPDPSEEGSTAAMAGDEVGTPDSEGPESSSGDVVQAVVDFVEDLVEDADDADGNGE